MDRVDRAQEIAHFVRGFLVAHGVDVRVDEDGVLTAKLPEDLAQDLGAPRKLRLSFSPTDVADAGKGLETVFLTFGHPLLDRMLAMAKPRGQATSLLLRSALRPDVLDAVRDFDPFSSESPTGQWHCAPGFLVRCFSRLSFPNAVARTLDKRVVFHAQVVFFFKVALISDEKRELVVSLWIDPVTEDVDRPVDLRDSHSFQLERSQDSSPEEYRFDRLYRTACARLESRLRRPMEAFQKEVSERLESELRRIEEYYSGLIQEQVEPLRKLFRRMAVASVRADLARTWQTEIRYRDEMAALKAELADLETKYEKELAAIQRGKAQRVREVKEKHHTRAEVTLTHAALVRVPRIEWRLRLIGQSARREVTLLADVLRRRLVGWECESCSGSLREQAFLCACSTLVCADCHHECAGCGRSHCRACSDGECHVCGRAVCPRCESVCPLFVPASPSPGPEAAMLVCRSCRDRWCLECATLCTFTAEGAVAVRET